MIKIYFTSDLHGFAFPVDFEKDENTLIIDGGDVLQGSPFAQYCWRELGDFSAIAEAMNKCGYDFVTLGNHDFNYGIKALSGYLDKLDAHCVCENAGYPYMIKTMPCGTKLGIVGIVTDFVNVWEKRENLGELVIGDAFEAAKSALTKLRGKVDMTICIYHGGFEKDFETGKLLSLTNENIGCKICEELDFDILLTGHQHIGFTGRYYHGTYLIQPPDSAKGYALLTIDGGKIDSGIQPADGFAGIPEARLERDVEAWLDESVGELPLELPMGGRLEMAVHGSPLADFFNHIQLKYSGAQVSATSLANDAKGLPRKLQRRDLFAAYPYNNTFVVLEITGAQLRAAIERSAEYLTYKDGKLAVSQQFLRPKVEHYNYDFYAGVDFEVDYRRPTGSRVSRLKIDDKEVSDDLVLSICINNYRASGAGGYEVYTQCPVKKIIGKEMVDLLLDYFTEVA